KCAATTKSSYGDADTATGAWQVEGINNGVCRSLHLRQFGGVDAAADVKGHHNIGVAVLGNIGCCLVVGARFVVVSPSRIDGTDGLECNSGCRTCGYAVRRRLVICGAPGQLIAL